MELPIYEFFIDDNDDETGVTAVSIVSDPAHSSKFIAFNKDKKQKYVFLSKDEKQYKGIVAGLSMIPEVKMYRTDSDGNGYYGFFTADTIEKIRNKFHKQLMTNKVNVEHDDNNYVNAYLVESYLLDSKERVEEVKAKGIEDAVLGAWFTAYKVDDKQLFKKVLKGDYAGFSVESYLMRELKTNNNNFKKQVKEMKKSLYSKFKEKLHKMVDAINFETALVPELNIEIEFGEAGEQVTQTYINAENQEVVEKLPKGEYVVEDGRTVVVDDNSILIEVRMPVVEETEEEMEEEEGKDKLDEIIEDAIADVIESKVKKVLDAPEETPAPEAPVAPVVEEEAPAEEEVEEEEFKCVRPKKNIFNKYRFGKQKFETVDVEIIYSEIGESVDVIIDGVEKPIEEVTSGKEIELECGLKLVVDTEGDLVEIKEEAVIEIDAPVVDEAPAEEDEVVVEMAEEDEAPAEEEEETLTDEELDKLFEELPVDEEIQAMIDELIDGDEILTAEEVIKKREEGEEAPAEDEDEEAPAEDEVEEEEFGAPDGNQNACKSGKYGECDGAGGIDLVDYLRKGMGESSNTVNTLANKHGLTENSTALEVTVATQKGINTGSWKEDNIPMNKELQAKWDAMDAKHSDFISEYESHQAAKPMNEIDWIDMKAGGTVNTMKGMKTIKNRYKDEYNVIKKQNQEWSKKQNQFISNPAWSELRENNWVIKSKRQEANWLYTMGKISSATKQKFSKQKFYMSDMEKSLRELVPSDKAGEYTISVVVDENGNYTWGYVNAHVQLNFHQDEVKKLSDEVAALKEKLSKINVEPEFGIDTNTIINNDFDKMDVYEKIAYRRGLPLL